MSYNNSSNLGPLPQGWIEEKDQQGRSYFVNTAVPNPSAVWEDPRLSQQQPPQYQQQQANQYAPPSDNSYQQQQGQGQGQSPYPPVSSQGQDPNDKGLMSNMMGKITGQNQNQAQQNPNYSQQYNGQQYQAQPQCEPPACSGLAPLRRTLTGRDSPGGPALQTLDRPPCRCPPRPATTTTSCTEPEGWPQAR